MSRAKFDVESDGRFLASVQDLGIGPATRLLLELKQMSDCVPWTEMIRDYHWQEVILSPTDCFPGAHQLYSFILYVAPGELYEVLAHNYAPPEVVCVLARVIKLE